jgi:hypothetical protein
MLTVALVLAVGAMWTARTALRVWHRLEDAGHPTKAWQELGTAAPTAGKKKS